ncbi:hypothetical protein D8B26_005269 [Coccidioides posadasii str. Silveira]|uniref:UBX domain-containing protein 2 n=1 Tax=Coccidioides posadasii (strain RMSCC 757 / Silveira) TaxID=443226 RepID=E9D4R6_COCPS|nr:conserved hypothetical protein [Coccidioides posadasii str. Silveira]QVM10614.1 hypothetical protein D8B26_005269 [Coccidioides posadasii str. Silveira]
MFYEGDLQSGITLAVQQAKQVVCFVRDEGEESTRWEDEYLADEEITQLLTSNSVALRLTAGSQEAGFLASFCPINKIPTLVAIKNGVLQEYIVSGTAEDELKERLKTILNPTQVLQASQSEALSQPTHQVPTPSPSSDNVNTPAPEPEPSEEETPAEIARRESVRQGKRRAASPEPVSRPGDPAGNTQKIWRQQQFSRERREREERERVLALIRQDKEERRARAEQQRLSHTQQSDSQDTEQRTRPITQRDRASEYRLQVRVFDGSSIRSKFFPTQTVRNDVRPWIDSQRTDGNTPYNLKQILTPLPNKTISISEENQSLSDLGLGPTANLVMVPIHSYTEAYATSESSLPVRGLYAGYNLLTGAVGTVAGALGSFLGLTHGQPASPPETSSRAEQATGAGENSVRNPRSPRSNNIRTLYDGPSDEADRQFYNGNQLNFEPRIDQDKND